MRNLGDAISEDMMSSSIKSSFYRAYEVIPSLCRSALIPSSSMRSFSVRLILSCCPTTYLPNINKFKCIFLSSLVSILSCLLPTSSQLSSIVSWASPVLNELSVISSTSLSPSLRHSSWPLRRFSWGVVWSSGSGTTLRILVSFYWFTFSHPCRRAVS